MRVFAMWDPANPMREVDLFAEHPMDFEGLWERSEIIALSQTVVRVASIADLDDWEVGWEAHRVHQLTLALAATPAQRLAWLEEMIALAWRVGTLPKPRG